MKQAITVTMIFEAPALNRDEGVGNTTSLKKLSRGWGEVYTFISRSAMRHYLWETLHRYDPERWKATPVRKDRDVIQFDVTRGGIDKYAELDVFGYMYTERGSKQGEGTSETRKGALGITRAISLEPWKNDMAMYANHDLVKRYAELHTEEGVGPNPRNSQEHYSFYKVAFTLDCKKIGVNDQGKLVITEEEREGRIKDVLWTIYSGMCYHVAGECVGIVPQFIVAGIVKVPIPIFFHNVRLKYVRENGRVCPKIDEEFLKTALESYWVERKGEKKLILIKSKRSDFISEEFKKFVENYSITTDVTGWKESDWEEFIDKYLFEKTVKIHRRL